jgi:hypothetical protein
MNIGKTRVGCTTAAECDAMTRCAGPLGASLAADQHPALDTGGLVMNLACAAVSCRTSPKEQGVVLKMCSHALVFPQFE